MTEARQRVAISGAGGFVGSALVRALRADGIEVIPLVRRTANRGEIQWDPDQGRIDRAALEGIDGFVHLAGESIAGLWTSAKKRRILESRARGTRLIARELARLERPPRILVSASGIGYYGDGGSEGLTEANPPGNDFLAHVCTVWEEETRAAADAGIRVVNTRFGVILDPAGGVLRPMLLPFRLGLGARLGTGRQWMSWITRADAVRALRFALKNDALSGPVNVTAPEPVTNAEFTEALARAVHRPAFLHVPEFALRTLAGEMAEALLLVSQRGIPAALVAAGFTFERPSIDEALHEVLDGSE